MREREGGLQGYGVVQHASPHWESEDKQDLCFLAVACFGKEKPQEPCSSPFAFATSSYKTQFSQSSVHVFLNSLPALVMIWVLSCPVQIGGFTRHLSLAVVGIQMSCHLWGGKVCWLNGRYYREIQ